jgi:hypothetical protein
VNFKDFALLAMHWFEGDCGIPYWCGKTDVDFSSTTDTGDLGLFTESWLTKVNWFLQPVGYWKFDEGQGDTAYDSVGNNDGTLIGDPCWVSGKIGDYALEFDGIDDYVDVGYLGEFPTWTISLWANSDTQGTYHTFISQDQTSWNDDILFGICPQGTSWSTRDKIAVIFHRADYTEYVVEDNENIQTGQWYNTIVTYDGSTMILYVNSIQKDSVVATDLVISDQRWTIGRNPHDNYPSPFRQFDGTIDDVRVYDRALSDEEIWQLYQKGND